MIRGLVGSIDMLAKACGLGVALCMAWSVPAAAQAQSERSIVGTMQRAFGSIPIIGNLAPKPAPDPGNHLAPPGGGPPPPQRLPGGQSLLPPPPIPPASIPGGPPSALGPPAPSPAPLAPPHAPPGVAPRPPQVSLALSARYGKEEIRPINGGIVWRIYPVKPDVTGVFHPVREERNPTPTLMLAPGDYVVHASFGLASAAKTVSLRQGAAHEVLDLPAGGIRLEGRVGDVPIPAGQISFDIFHGSQFEPDKQRPIAHGVMTGHVVVVPGGNYHIVSNYGDSNSIVRSDIRVQVGKLTDVLVTHRAAVITLKLVGERGGEALANTSWSVLTPGGDVVKESIGAFPKVILAAGDYRAIARNEGKMHERDFTVITGVDGEIELVAR